MQNKFAKFCVLHLVYKFGKSRKLLDIQKVIEYLWEDQGEFLMRWQLFFMPGITLYTQILKMMRDQAGRATTKRANHI
jgi:hypothetical protein